MREIRLSGSVRGVRRNPYPYRDPLIPMRSMAGLYDAGSDENGRGEDGGLDGTTTDADAHPCLNENASRMDTRRKILQQHHIHYKATSGHSPQEPVGSPASLEENCNRERTNE